jgi:general stress protein 26
MSVENLTSQEAIDKIKELAKAADICLFTTDLTTLPLMTRPMSVSEVDDAGNLWFMSRKDSDKNRDIEEDDRVQLFFSNKGSYEFLSIYGRAIIVQDTEKAKELWTPIAKTWFNGGVEDPELTLIRVHPEDAYYWDTKHNKAVTLLSYLAGAITGKELDNGVQGKISV